MADEITIGEVYRLLQSQSEDISEIKRDVKAQNGTVARHETRITVLEERTPSGGRQGAMAGGAVAGVMGLIEIIRHVLSKP